MGIGHVEKLGWCPCVICDSFDIANSCAETEIKCPFPAFDDSSKFSRAFNANRNPRTKVNTRESWSHTKLSNVHY